MANDYVNHVNAEELTHAMQEAEAAMVASKVSTEAD